MPPVGSVLTDSDAANTALQAALLLGAQAMYVTAWDSMIWASGIPTLSTAWAAAAATTRAWGSALPTSSEAHMRILRAMNPTSSPA